MKQISTILLFLGVSMLSDQVNMVSAETIIEDIGEQDPAAGVYEAKSRSRPKLSPEEIAQRKKAKRE